VILCSSGTDEIIKTTPWTYYRLQPYPADQGSPP